MDKLPQKLKGLKLDELEFRILEAIKYVDNALLPILSVSQKGRAPSIYHSEYQIVSMIATAFLIRYNPIDLIEVDGWKSVYKKLEANIRMHYLYDILREEWRGSGDAKLYEVTSNLKYVKNVPSKNSWVQLFDSWFEDTQLPLSQFKRYTRDQSPEILLLKYIYCKKWNLEENSRVYHIEHIVPVEQLIKAMNGDSGWPINSIGNLALLEQDINQKKHDHTFVEYLKKSLDTGKMSEEVYNTKLKDLSDRLLCTPDSLPKVLTRNSYISFLVDRFAYLQSTFIGLWADSIPNDH